jgi:hypothetical protein
MGRLNADPLVTLPDGSPWLVSTQASRDGHLTYGL